MNDETLMGRLKSLSKAATQQNMRSDGTCFEDMFTDVIETSGECDRGYALYGHKPDGEFIAALWNAWRAGKLVVRDDSDKGAA